MSLFLACVRVWLIGKWCYHGWHKLGSARWVGSEAGASVRKFAAEAVQRASGEHPTVHPLYAVAAQRLFLPLARPISYVVLISEALLPFGLLIPRLTRLSAAFGALLNILFLMGGEAHDNPGMLFAELILIVGHRRKRA